MGDGQCYYINRFHVDVFVMIYIHAEYPNWGVVSFIYVVFGINTILRPISQLTFERWHWIVPSFHGIIFPQVLDVPVGHAQMCVLRFDDLRALDDRNMTLKASGFAKCSKVCKGKRMPTLIVSPCCEAAYSDRALFVCHPSS